MASRGAAAARSIFAHQTKLLCSLESPTPPFLPILDRQQDPSLNLLFDRAFDEFRDSAPTQGKHGAGDDDDAAVQEEDSSRMIGIVSRLGGGKRALAVGLGSGGPAGENAWVCRLALAAHGVFIGKIPLRLYETIGVSVCGAQSQRVTILVG